MYKTLMQVGIVVPAIVGTLSISISSDYWELLGWCLYIISDMFGIVYFARDKSWLLVSQYLVFTAIAINGILQRIG